MDEQPTQATNAHRCLLAEVCAQAGDPAHCHDGCASFNAMHSASGRHTQAGLPADYALTTLANSPAAESQAQNYETFSVYVERMIKQFTGERIKSLYLVSSAPGTGKTTSAAALLNEYLRMNYVGHVQRAERPPKRPVYFFDVNAWQTLHTRLHTAMGDRKEVLAAQFEKARERALSAEFAVFDDIGVRGATEGFRGQLHDLINDRVTARKPTVYTSNVPISELAGVFDERLADRIGEQCAEIHFSGESKRGLRKE